MLAWSWSPFLRLHERMEDEFEDKEVVLEERVISEPETPRLERWAISRLRSAIESAGDIVILFVPHAVRIRNVIGGMLKVATVTKKQDNIPTTIPKKFHTRLNLSF